MRIDDYFFGRRAEVLFKTCVRAINHYGQKHQVGKAMEEMSELKLEIEREQDGRTDVHRICGEIADVLFTEIQMAIMYGPDEVFDKLEFKIRRLNEQISKEQKNTER